MLTGQQQALINAFLEPINAAHRQYEALRAYFVEGLSSAQAARRFGYTPGSFRVLACEFRKDPGRRFFVDAQRGPTKDEGKSRLHEHIVALRKENLSVYDISRVLASEGRTMTPAGISVILRKHGFARLPRRRDDERPEAVQPVAADAADARRFDLGPRSFHTQFGGLFLFLPFLARIPLDEIAVRADMPGTEQVPAAHALRSLLALKLFGSARHSHVMSWVLDEGLALFAGLNVIPKRSFLTEYSCRIHPDAYPVLMRLWFDAVGAIGLAQGDSFDLDFHTIPFHGDDALVEKHYVSKRSRSQKGVLAFLAQDAGTRVFCYATSEILKKDQADEILRFIDFWQQRTGRLPEELVFDSKLTTYANLNALDQRGIPFITLRRRSKKMLEQIEAEPMSAWRRVELEAVARAYRTPRVLDRTVRIPGYNNPIRELVIAELGHEDPTFLLTNQLRRSAGKLIGRYAQRMIIENSIADGIDFFHMDALSSAVAMKVNCDLQLTLMASSLYRLLGTRIGGGYTTAKSRRIFRDFVQANADVTIGPDVIRVRFQKRARNPLLAAAGFDTEVIPVPWFEHRKVELVLG